MIIQARIAKKVVPVTVTPDEKRYIISFPYFKPLVEEVKAMETPQWDPETRTWSVANTERNLYTLDQWERRHDPVYDSPISRSFTDTTLLKHQSEGLTEAINRRRIILGHEMGLGKTLTSIKVMENLGGMWWIICPKGVKISWKAELLKWKSPLVEGKNFLIMHYEKFIQLLTSLPLPDHVIFDEAHKIRNPQAQRTQGAFIVGQHCRKRGGATLLLTGTPQPKDPSDWWTYAEILQPGYLRESTKAKFARRLGEYQTNVNKAGIEYQTLIKWKEDELNLIPKRLGNMAHIRLKKYCLDIPEKIYKEEQLDAEPEIAKQIKMVLSLSSSGAATLNSLRQLSDGFQYRSELSFTSPKEERLKELLEEISPRVVIYAAYHKSIDKVVSLVEKEGWEVIRNDGRGYYFSNRTLTENNWLEYFSDVHKHGQRVAYIGHPERGGIGLNLQAANTCIFYSNDFKADNRRQAEDRIHRIGTRGATIIDLLWLPSDKYVLENLRRKRDLELVSIGELKDYVDKEMKEKWNQ